MIDLIRILVHQLGGADRRIDHSLFIVSSFIPENANHFVGDPIEFQKFAKSVFGLEKVFLHQPAYNYNTGLVQDMSKCCTRRGICFFFVEARKIEL